MPMRNFKAKLCIHLLVFSIAFNSCQKAAVLNFDGPASIYFYESNRPLKHQGELLRDYSLVEFSQIQSKDTVKAIVLATISKPAVHDRPYLLEIDPSSTAILGQHYTLLNKDFLIRKNQSLDTLYIRWHRTRDMQEAILSLKLLLKANTHFNTELQESKADPRTGLTTSYIQHDVRVHDMIPKPIYWLDDHFHTFSSKKFLLFCAVFSMEPLYFINLRDAGEMMAMAKVMQRYLNDQKAAGKTIYELNGEEMRMGNEAQ